jgi:hypothetical protein
MQLIAAASPELKRISLAPRHTLLVARQDAYEGNDIHGLPVLYLAPNQYVLLWLFLGLDVPCVANVN